MSEATSPANSSEQPRWSAEVGRYEWLVLAIASAGWIFDVYEGQIFNITRNQMLAEILGVSVNSPTIKNYGDLFLGIFLAGGTVGGLGFGSMADRYGRRPVMIVTILMYSLFSGLTYFVESLWQVAALRFLVAMGVGGEWAVAASLVSEVFPIRLRAQASGIFHASSVLGTWMAAMAGILVGMHWRYVYLIGILPALLILWIRASVREPENWQKKKKKAGGPPMGSFRDLLMNRAWSGRALLGMTLAAVGLGTFWAVTVAGQDLTRELLQRNGVESADAESSAKFAYGFVETFGGGIGLLAFGPLCARLGRRPTFILYHALAVVIVPVTCFVPQTYSQLLCLLPLFGFFTLGMHAGYAIYFPELFPTHLRATGTSFCFNGGRLVAVPVLVLSGWLKGTAGMDLRWVVTGLAALFLVGIAVVCFLPETLSQDLPD